MSIGANLIANGDFSRGQDLWAINAGMGVVTVQNGQLCVAVAAGQYAVLGWPSPPGTPGLPLAPGASYQFSYIAQATPPVAIDAKVGHTVAPYAPDFDTPLPGDPIPSAFMPFAHPFTAPTSPAENSAGVAFLIPETGTTRGPVQVCFLNVSLVQN
jgi:hypothetical protein